MLAGIYKCSTITIRIVNPFDQFSEVKAIQVFTCRECCHWSVTEVTAYIYSIVLESHLAFIQKFFIKIFVLLCVGEVFEMGFLRTFLLINNAEVLDCVCTSIIVALLMISSWTSIAQLSWINKFKTWAAQPLPKICGSFVSIRFQAPCMVAALSVTTELTF